MTEIIIITIVCGLVLVAMGMELQKWMDRRKKSGGLK